MCKSHMYYARWYFPWKGLQDVLWGKKPCSCSISCSTRSPFQHFSIPQDPHFNQKITKFPNFLFKMPKFGKFSVPKPKNRSKFSSGNLNWAKNQFWKQHFVQKISSTSPKFGADLFYKPPFSAFSGYTPHTQTKIEYPSGTM